MQFQLIGPPPPPAPIPFGGRLLLLSRAYAAQAGAYVIAASGFLLKEHVPARYSELCTIDLTGQSYIIDPRGEVLAGPAEGETILIAEGSMEAVLAAKVAADLGGHYSLRGIPTRPCPNMDLCSLGCQRVARQ